LFAGRTGQPIRPDNLTDRFNQLAEAAKVRPIDPHQIRHLIASTLLDAGYGVHEAAERLGHDLSHPDALLRPAQLSQTPASHGPDPRIDDSVRNPAKVAGNWGDCTTSLVPDVGKSVEMLARRGPEDVYPDSNNPRLRHPHVDARVADTGERSAKGGGL
jgi:hypothetical protein